MGFKDLFKTKAEQKAYAKGRRDQYNKEHPLMRWGIETTTFHYNSDGSLSHKTKGRILPGSKFKTKREALTAFERAVNNERYQKERVLKASRSKNVNIYDSQDCQYDTYKIVKINERKI